MGDWVFGCDLCQEVCPVNRKAAPSREPDFQKRPDFDAPDLFYLLELDDDDFRARFEGSPIRRAKREGLQRNACVSLGNIGRPVRRSRPWRKALESGGDLVRPHAAWALGRIGTAEATAALDRALNTESEAEVRREIAEALAESD